MIEEVKNKAKELLRTKQVDLIIGYKRASDGVFAIPCFIYKEKEADVLIWDAYCVYNLANYLKDFPGNKVGIIAKDCDIKSIIVLLQENQLKREDVFIIGIECMGVVNEKKLDRRNTDAEEIGYHEKCRACKPAIPVFCDVVIAGEKKEPAHHAQEDAYVSVRTFEAKSLKERFKFWEEEFKRCIRCYACRQVCPMCYCPRCVADQSMPAWFSRATDYKGNLSWNLTRAIHLAGRCIDCGECERVCPVGIPLRDINKKLEKDVQEMFKYTAGTSIEQKPLLAGFDKNDPDEFIK
ncbi:MAG: 4Fe-4S dicluster domain-containing protein [Candidatus Omnitrophota bacterium]